MPLAATGIMCLGLVPLLGGPERPLHWAVTAGMVGFGALLWARRRLRGAEGPLPAISKPAAQAAGRSVLMVAGVITLLVGVVVGFRLHSGGELRALSLALPAAALVWLVVLGLQMLGHRGPPTEAAGTGDRPSRRPPPWDGVSNQNRPSRHPDPHASA